MLLLVFVLCILLYHRDDMYNFFFFFFFKQKTAYEMRISDWSSDVCSSDLFKGSAGFACVLLDEAAIFVDGRYTLQVGQEVDVSLFTPRHVTDEPLAAWLEERLKPGQRLAYDPWLHTEEQVRRLERSVTALGASPAALDGNPIEIGRAP